MEIKFNKLEGSDLIIDCIYKGGTSGNTSDDHIKWYGDEQIPDEILADFKNGVIERIDNKMLLYGDDNSSASNNNYNAKKNVYMNGKRGQNQGTPIGTFILTKELINKYPEKFNHTEVDKRAKSLSDLAILIWN